MDPMGFQVTYTSVVQAEVNRPQCDHASPLFVAAENAHAAGDFEKSSDVWEIKN